jgi:hypothetical protein
MVRKGDSVFFRLGEDAAQGELHRGSVEAAEGCVCVVRLEQPCPQIEEAVEGFLHFDRQLEFMQQSAVIARTGSDDPLRFSVELRGQPVSAQSLQSYRVSCLGTQITATFGHETGCEVLDVSATGFAVYARGQYSIGQCLPAALHYAGQSCAGDVAVQSVRRMSPQKIRYGVYCVDDARQHTLAKSLASINLAIQREQLRRMTGSR